MRNIVSRSVVRGGLPLALVFATASRPAVAQYMQSGSYLAPHAELTALAGGFFPSSVYASSALTFNPVESWLYGARLAYIGSSGLGAEFSWVRTVSDVNATGCATGCTGGPVNNQHVGSVGLNMYDVDGIFQSSARSQAIGYFVFGLGATDIDNSVPVQGSSGGLRFSWNIGIGAKIKPSISSPWAIRIDGRYRGTYLDRSTNAYTSCTPYYGCWSYSTNNYSSGEVTFGIVYSFKGK
jgi:hypothetical protein